MRLKVKRSPWICFLFAACLWIGFGQKALASWDCTVTAPAPGANSQPQPPAANRDLWLHSFHSADANIENWQPEIVFLGDSLTYLWPDNLWKQAFASQGVFNYGFSGDTTGNLLWRFQNGGQQTRAAKMYIVLIGTNDLTKGSSPEEVANGIRTIMQEILKDAPAAKIILIGLWPRGKNPDNPFRRKVADVNSRIKSCEKLPRVTFLDVGGLLLDPNGVLTKEVSKDELHLTEEGYGKIVGPIKDALNHARSGG
jgi:lysophospholipase L1-like esterase